MSSTTSSSSSSATHVDWIDDVGLVVYQHFYSFYNTYLAVDDASLDITGELTFGCWVYFSPGSSGSVMGIANKWYTSGLINQRSYALFKNANDDFVFSISDDGTGGAHLFALDDSLGIARDKFEEEKWFYIVCRFTPSTEMALFVNGVWYKDTTNIPASIFNSTEAFEVGRYNHASYLNGRESHVFICAYSVPDRFIEAMYAHSMAMFKSRSFRFFV